MAQEELQRLVLRVDANINRYERQLNRMEGVARQSTRRTEAHFQRMGRNLNRAGMRFAGQFTAAIAGVASVAALSRASAATLQYAQDLESASERIGFSIERLQEYRFAADQNGIATRALDMGLQRFSRRVAEAAQGTGELRTTLEQYNIQIRNADGSMRSINDIFRDYADAIAGADNQSEALRLAFKAFDSEGAALVEFLRQGSDGLDRFSARAREAGVVMEENLVRQGAAAQRTIDELKASVGADFNRAVLENVEGLEALAEVLGAIARFAVQAAAGMGEFARNLAEPDSLERRLREANQLVGLTERRIASERQRIADAQAIIDDASSTAGQRRLAESIIGSAEEDIAHFEQSLAALNAQIERYAELQARIAGRRAMYEPGGGRAPATTPSTGGGSTNLQDQEAAREREEEKNAAREAQAELNAQRKQDMIDLLAEENERKRELELELARDAADEYLDTLEQNREKFVRLFSDTMTNGVRAAFEGNLPEYAARRMQEAFYDRLSRLFDQLANAIFDRSRGKGSGSADFLTTVAAFFAGGRASGGPVSPGMAYRVGESGPEYFVPSQRGMIVPEQSAMNQGRSGGPITIRLQVDEGAMFETRVVEISGPLAERAGVTAVATVRSDMEQQSQRQLRRLR